jgi:hypothetical protein
MNASAGSRGNYEHLLDCLVDGLLTEGEHNELSQRVLTDPAARERYVSHVVLHAMLKLEHARPIVPLDAGLPNSSGILAKKEVNEFTPSPVESALDTRPEPVGLLHRFAGGIVRHLADSPLVTTAVVAMVCYGTFALLAWNLRSDRLPHHDAVDDVAVAVIGVGDDARWSEETTAKADHSAIRLGEPLKLDRGIVELELKSGTKLVVEGPAEWAVGGDNKATLRAGKLMATVPPNAVGFTLETPTAKIVDLGTEFAAEVGVDQHTQIHVFKGTVVALQVQSSADSNDAVRLSAGEAIEIGGRSAPFTSIPIRPDRYLKAAKPKPKSVIAAVQASNGEEYRIVPGGLRDDALSYIDRAYEWNGIDKNGLPAILVGADYVQTACDDKNDHIFEMYVTVSKPATLYVFFDKDIPKTPDWITKFFTDSGWEVGLDAIPAVGKGPGESIDRTFTVWKRQVKAGTTWLGPNAWNGGHYGVAAVADPVTETPAKARSK